ncbi:MAG: AMP-binding protein, partial [Mycobacteriaceae bacterium]
PTVANWVHWRTGSAEQPMNVHVMSEELTQASDSGVTMSSRVGHGLTSVAEVGFGLTKGMLSMAASTGKSARAVAEEAVRTLPRLARLGQIQGHTQISLGRLMSEQSKRAPNGECFLFDDRVHTNHAVDQRINNVVRGLIYVGIRQGVHVGVLMETRPSALVAVAALSRLGAVAVLLPPHGDLADAIRISEVKAILVDPPHLSEVKNSGLPSLILGGGDTRVVETVGDGNKVIDLEKVDPDEVKLPGWYRPNPGRARDLAFVLFSRESGYLVAKQVTNHRWALSAFGTASAAALGSGDTVYCLTPLYHPSGLLASLGGAVAGGSRIALSRGLDPNKFAEEVQRYGVTVVSYTWTMLREVVDMDGLPTDGHHSIRLFIGSGMPTGLWRRVTEKFSPAMVLEFFASTEGEAVLANVAGVKVGSKGRPLPGGAELELGAYDPLGGRLIEDKEGFVQPCKTGEVGLLLARPRGGCDSGNTVMRGVFEAGDSWIATDYLFRRDIDGDYWLVGNKHFVIKGEYGPIFAEPINDAIGSIVGVDLAMTYAVPAIKSEIAVTAITLIEDPIPSAADIGESLSALEPESWPDVVHVVDSLPIGSSYRPSVAAARLLGAPSPGDQAWYLDRGKHVYKKLTSAVADDLFSWTA